MPLTRPIGRMPLDNGLLAALPDSEYESLHPHLNSVLLPLGTSLYEGPSETHYVYFPTEAIIALMCVMEDGKSGEIAVAGREGLVGISLLMGGYTTPTRATVRMAGHAYRIRSTIINEAFSQAGELQRLMLRYTQALFTQIAQTSACNRHHSVEQQLCRWLLLSDDRSPHRELKMTHELIASMLGVRREGVTEAAGRLQKSGLITYHRGRLVILDRPGLENRSCECYGVIASEYARLLGEPAASQY
ncbi:MULTISPECIES: Crp/Fnr family transcriptional regulator [unclassified Thioalkalivibrio]|uniref:Crp/Fnr family transcriptional regulator n=1 Tax=unclassified Thioalkalivibrio TaxID=2621013 RepID=UPI0004764981|nr:MULTISPECIES: Crp/Fnr family transcriptional regulator [unclassified Thioalkalivibrio]